MQSMRTILVAEIEAGSARRLARCLISTGAKVLAAASAEGARQLLRREIFDGAVVAAELTLGQELVVGCLSRLPATKMVVAIGPAGDAELEAAARMAGADCYLPRPVSAEAVIRAFGTHLPGAGGSRASPSAGHQAKARAP